MFVSFLLIVFLRCTIFKSYAARYTDNLLRACFFSFLSFIYLRSLFSRSNVVERGIMFFVALKSIICPRKNYYHRSNRTDDCDSSWNYYKLSFYIAFLSSKSQQSSKKYSYWGIEQFDKDSKLHQWILSFSVIIIHADYWNEQNNASHRFHEGNLSSIEAIISTK